jgi:hypothetical protein
MLAESAWLARSCACAFGDTIGLVEETVGELKSKVPHTRLVEKYHEEYRPEIAIDVFLSRTLLSSLRPVSAFTALTWVIPLPNVFQNDSFPP